MRGRHLVHVQAGQRAAESHVPDVGSGGRDHRDVVRADALQRLERGLDRGRRGRIADRRGGLTVEGDVPGVAAGEPLQVDRLDLVDRVGLGAVVVVAGQGVEDHLPGVPLHVGALAHDPERDHVRVEGDQGVERLGAGDLGQLGGGVGQRARRLARAVLVDLDVPGGGHQGVALLGVVEVEVPHPHHVHRVGGRFLLFQHVEFGDREHRRSPVVGADLHHTQVARAEALAGAQGETAGAQQRTEVGRAPEVDPRAAGVQRILHLHRGGDGLRDRGHGSEPT